MMLMKKLKTQYKCSHCGIAHPTWKGQCPSCKTWNTFTEVAIAKKNYSIPKFSVKRRALNEIVDPHELELSKWFDYQTKEALDSGFTCCENCGEDLQYYLKSQSNFERNSCHAHIVPKSKYKSVSLHPDNHLLLCLSCHSGFDSSWENASKQSVWGLAIIKVRLFFNLITESTTHLPKQFTHGNS